MTLSASFLVALVLALLIGITLGLLGGGGSILTVPVLTYVVGFPPAEAITASLFVVGVTAFVSVVRHARGGRVVWRTGLGFGVAGMVGAFAGGAVGSRLPGTLLMVMFAVMMLVTATAMIRPRRKPASVDTSPSPRRTARVIATGVGVGFITSMVGAGGGFLIVPALTLLGLPMAMAVGTSLLVIGLQASAGLASHLLVTPLDWPVVLAVTAVAVVGSFVGASLVDRIPGPTLRRAFGVFVLAMGVIVLALELPGLWS